jgi:putative ABC transport system permease protein
MTVETLATHQLRPRDLAGTGLAGLRARPMRVVLSALGIAIGIAAMVGVVGISASGRARLDAELARLGTNLLTATPGQTLFGDQAELPDESVAMAARIGPVTAATATGLVQHARVYRNDRIPATNSNGIAVLAARTDLLHTVGGTVRGGRFLSAATDRYPAVVLGATTARLLGLPPASTNTQIKVGNRWFTVVGVLNPVPLAPELDDAALVGWPVARQLLGFDGHPTTVYERSADAAVPAVESVLAATVNPAHPDQVVVSRPSDALAARAATNTTFTELLLGLGAVALLVGGVGVANTMVISVLERRAEIGLRRALGATRGHVRVQFLAESLLLSLLGGTAGVLLGIGVTVCYAAAAGTPVAVPSWALAGGIGATVVIGGLAGLYPATRAARLSPTEALAAP